MGLALSSPQEGSALLQDRGINRAPARAGSGAGPAELPALTLRVEQGLPQELGVDSRAQSCRTAQSQGTAEERETERGPPSKLGANFSRLSRNNSAEFLAHVAAECLPSSGADDNQPNPIDSDIHCE